MNDRLLKRLILEELHKVLKEDLNVQQAKTAAQNPTYQPRYKTPTRSEPEIQDALQKAKHSPEAGADFILAQLKSAYIDDVESKAILQIVMDNKNMCLEEAKLLSNDKKMNFIACKDFINRTTPNIIQAINYNWKTPAGGQQYADKLQVIRAFQDIFDMIKGM